MEATFKYIVLQNFYNTASTTTNNERLRMIDELLFCVRIIASDDTVVKLTMGIGGINLGLRSNQLLAVAMVKLTMSFVRINWPLFSCSLLFRPHPKI